MPAIEAPRTPCIRAAEHIAKLTDDGLRQLGRDVLAEFDRRELDGRCRIASATHCVGEPPIPRKPPAPSPHQMPPSERPRNPDAGDTRALVKDGLSHQMWRD